jgi:hypothetical protein
MQTYASPKQLFADDIGFALEVGKELLGVSKWPVYLIQAIFTSFNLDSTPAKQSCIEMKWFICRDTNLVLIIIFTNWYPILLTYISQYSNRRFISLLILTGFWQLFRGLCTI